MNDSGSFKCANLTVWPCEILWSVLNDCTLVFLRHVSSASITLYVICVTLSQISVAEYLSHKR